MVRGIFANIRALFAKNLVHIHGHVLAFQCACPFAPVMFPLHGMNPEAVLGVAPIEDTLEQGPDEVSFISSAVRHVSNSLE